MTKFIILTRTGSMWLNIRIHTILLIITSKGMWWSNQFISSTIAMAHNKIAHTLWLKWATKNWKFSPSTYCIANQRLLIYFKTPYIARWVLNYVRWRGETTLNYVWRLIWLIAKDLCQTSLKSGTSCDWVDKWCNWKICLSKLLANGIDRWWNLT